MKGDYETNSRFENLKVLLCQKSPTPHLTPQKSQGYLCTLEYPSQG
jgi:hypothetical protein